MRTFIFALDDDYIINTHAQYILKMERFCPTFALVLPSAGLPSYLMQQDSQYIAVVRRHNLLYNGPV